MDFEQLSLGFQGNLLALLSADEIYERADAELLGNLHEDRRLERKPAGIHAKALGDYFSMWSNTVPDGGIIAIGIENDGQISGCGSIGDERLNELERAGYIYCPDSRYESKRVPARRHDGKDDFVLLFRVFYRPDKVVETVSGDAFTRIGDSKRKLSPEEIKELQIDKRQVDFELEPVTLIYPKDFDIDLVRQFANGVRSVRELSDELTEDEILEVRHLGKRELGLFKPNVASALLFASDPRLLLPGCKIRFMRFDGEHEQSGEKFNVVKDIWIEGPVPRQIVELERVLDSHIRDFTRLGKDGKFYTAPEYPKLAWYEAVVNACVHRSYGLKNMNIFVKMFDDHLVIESPGGFPPLVTPQNIYNVHHPRNPYLMEAMFYLRFVKCAHEGTRRIRDSMADMSLPQPEFEQKESGNAVVRVTLRNNIKQRKVWLDSDASAILGETILKTLSKHEIRVINFVAENGMVKVSQVQRLCGGLTWPAAKKLLSGLVKKEIFDHKRRENLERDPQASYVLKGNEPQALKKPKGSSRNPS